MPIEKIITKKNLDIINFGDQHVYSIYFTTENNEEDYWKYITYQMNSLKDRVCAEIFDIISWNIGEKKKYEIILINKDKIINCKLRNGKTKELVFEINFELPKLEIQTILKGKTINSMKTDYLSIFIKKLN
jgi:hypothetical protein